MYALGVFSLSLVFDASFHIMRKFILFAFVMLSFVSFSQEWTELMQSPTANFYDIQRSFNDYWKTHDQNEKGKGFKAFKRWEHFVEPRVYPSGNMSQLVLSSENYEKWFSDYQATKATAKGLGGSAQLASSTWTALGPFGALAGNAGGQFLKSGRLNFITIDPTSTVNIWAGAPAGGLWKSTNSGSSWTTNTDFLSVVGCSDLAIDPTNTSVMYLATGDGDAGDTRSIGVLKSTNGGATWNTTGLNNSVTSYFLIRRILIDPSNTQNVFAATSNGIYKTTNGGTNWTLVAVGSTFDMEFKPGNSSVIYAAGATFSISTNGGASFSQVSTGIPTSGCNRMAVAVTPADPNYVYVVASSSSNSGLQGFYRSIVSGSVFTQQTTTLNLLGYNSNGADAGGQGWYDLCIAASPLNRDEVVVGGVNIWKTTNGGGAWTIDGQWVGNGAPFVHADQHDLEYNINGLLYATNDGSIYYRTSTAWVEIGGTMNISQIYRIGLSALSPNRWITGHQDNGTSIFAGGTYSAMLGGDGMDCFIDRTTNNNVYGTYQYGAYRRSTTGGSSWSVATTGLSGTPGWVAPWKQDPVNSNLLYAGYTNLFVSNNLAASWSTLTAIPGSGTIKEFNVSPANNSVIYVVKSNAVYKTTDAGSSWSNVTSNLPVTSASPEWVTCSPTNSNVAWVCFSGYSNGNKVFMTNNGGSSWSNISNNLPNIPANCMVYQPSTNDLIYVGMDVGVYYKDNSTNNWTLWNTGLPNAPISELEITPATPTLLYAATFGRGVWAVSLYAPNAPLSSFSVNSNYVCNGSAITFTDNSQNLPSTWSWSVSPSSGAILSGSAVANPTITFFTTGTYTVKMQAANSSGTGSITTQTVVVSSPPAITVAAQNNSICLGSAVTLTATGASTYTWMNGNTTNVGAFSPTASGVFSVTGTSSVGCAGTGTFFLNVIKLTPSVNVNPTVCEGSTVSILASGASSYTWNNGTNGPVVTVSPSVTTVYTVTATNLLGCTGTATSMVTVNPAPIANYTISALMICEGETAVLEADGGVIQVWEPGNVASNSYTVSPAATTVYTLTVTDAIGCSNSTQLTVSVSTCEDLANSASVGNVKIDLFPNPTKNKLTINFSNNLTSTVMYTLVDATGKLITSGELPVQNKTASINLQNYAQGIYFLKLTSGSENSRMMKVIRE